jgi:hypothetical protein
MRILALIAAVALTLTGCAEPFNAQVKRFQSMPAPGGQTFAIRASEPAKANSLEFSHYADLVAAKLSAQGYRLATSPDAATLVVNLDYGVDKGKTMTRAEPFYGYGGWGGYGPWGYGPIGYHGYRGYHGWHAGFAYGYDPFLFGGYDRVESYVIYTSGLEMKIDNKVSGQRVFEGHAKAVSSVDTLTYLVPNLIDAMFTGFPGNSGETVKITVAPPKKS